VMVALCVVSTATCASFQLCPTARVGVRVGRTVHLPALTAGDNPRLLLRLHPLRCYPVNISLPPIRVHGTRKCV
jgi:hypothetical protein